MSSHQRSAANRVNGELAPQDFDSSKNCVHHLPIREHLPQTFGRTNGAEAGVEIVKEREEATHEVRNARAQVEDNY